jgi:hypothetical protein
VVGAIVVLVLVFSGFWVYVDALQRDWSNYGEANKAWKWALGVVVLWPNAFPVYLAQRGQAPRIDA